MLPRLRLDIGWLDLFSALRPPKDRAALELDIAKRAPSGSTAVAALSVRTLYDAILSETGNSPVVMSAVTIEEYGRTRAG